MTAVRPEFVIDRMFDAPRDLVWSAWTEAERLGAWWGPKGASIRVARLDLRPGGTFHYAMQFPHAEIWGRFVFEAIDPPERLVFVNSFSDPQGGVTRAPFPTIGPTWPLEIRNVVTFAAEGKRTRMVLRASPINATDEEYTTFAGMLGSLEQGFGGSFGKLDDHLARHSHRSQGAGMRIDPYLFFKGNCEEAFRFYEKVLGGKIEAMLPHEGTPAAEHVGPDWQKKIMHACLLVDGDRLMASDAPPGHDHDKSAGFAVSLHPKSVADGERIFNGLKEGGTVTMPFQPTFWAKGFGMLTDRFGTPWMINCDQ